MESFKDKKSLEIIDCTSWNEAIGQEIGQDVQKRATEALESGKVLFFPKLAFPLLMAERAFLSPDLVDPKSKNISYNLASDKLGGALCDADEALKLKAMIRRYATQSREFLNALIPHYTKSLIQARTSFRPVEIFGRKSSYRKDDTLLHVDAFPATPTKGSRILRLFTNVNPDGKPRHWRTGEPFEDVVKHIAPGVKGPSFLLPYFLKWLKVTKDFRTAYDHYMLQMHDAMKGDAAYQKSVTQEEIFFPPNSSWMVYTDQVSHAAMSGQHVFEQTFYLPVNGLKNESTAPLRILERRLGKALV